MSEAGDANDEMPDADGSVGDVEPDELTGEDRPPLTLGDMEAALEETTHPRHAEAVEANARLAERMRPFRDRILEQSGVSKVAEAFGKAILSSASASVGVGIGSQFTAFKPVPYAGLFDRGATIPELNHVLAIPPGLGVPHRQLEALEDVSEQMGELVAIARADADAARQDAARSARSTRHGLLIGWIGVALAAVAVIVSAIHG